MKKGRETKGAPAADLLVCFPSRAHLSLMPKPICSPARSSELNKRHHHNHLPHHHQHHPHLRHLRKSSTRGSTGQASPLLWAKPKSSLGSTELVSEPTSPKVTCAGQIKVRHKTSSCKSWQSVMEEIERMHNSRKQRKSRPSWAKALGLKKDVMQFLACLRNIRLDFRCFGSFHGHGPDITTDDELDEEEEEEDETFRDSSDGAAAETSRTVFSKWFTVLQEEQNNIANSNNNIGFCKEDYTKGKITQEVMASVPGAGDEGPPAVPPPNALLLMRCRSAPAKSWLEEKEEEKQEYEKDEEDDDEEDEDEDEDQKKTEEKRSTLKCLMEDEKRKTTESLVIMRYDPDFYKISSDIAKETWVVGGIRDPLSRSRSWKR